MATEKGGFFDAASGLTPQGFAANIAAEAISTPNTSASGDITTGSKHFSGIQTGGNSIPGYVWLGVLALAAVWLMRR